MKEKDGGGGKAKAKEDTHLILGVCKDSSRAVEQ